MEAAASSNAAKPKRVLTEEQLENLKHARELALKKRREMAAARAVDREALVLEKINAKKQRDDTRAEKIATQRLERRLDEPGAELRERSSIATDAIDAERPAEVARPKRHAVVVETSDSDEEEGLIDNARVFVVKREREAQFRERSPIATVAAPPKPPKQPAKVDPHAALYRSMFG